MPLFDHTAKRLAGRPSVLFPTEPAGEFAALLHSYDPAVSTSADKISFGNGVRLYGPINVTPDLVRKAKLPPGMATAYYTVVAFGAEAHGRTEDAMWEDAERLVRGLAPRLGGVVHNPRPPAKLNLEVTVFGARPLPPGPVIEALQPFVDTGPLVAEDNSNVPDSYALGTEATPAFFTIYWPPSISRTKLGLPPPALGGRLGDEPCRWMLSSGSTVENTPADARHRIAEAALALARTANGIVIDPYGFPIDRPGELVV